MHKPFFSDQYAAFTYNRFNSPMLRRCSGFLICFNTNRSFLSDSIKGESFKTSKDENIRKDLEFPIFECTSLLVTSLKDDEQFITIIIAF